MFSGKIYIPNFSGLANRLEAASLALHLQRTGSKRVILDWPELDAFTIKDMEVGPIPWWARLLRSKLTNCHSTLPTNIQQKKIIMIKAIYGPSEIMRQATRQLAQLIHPVPAISAAIQETFRHYADRPVVGIHLRRGDFKVAEGGHYLPSTSKHVAPPLWWYEHVMRSIVESQPDTAFFIAHNSDENSILKLREKFTVIESASFSSYDHKISGHQSKTHPVADLLALACCHIVIATPYSSFSHWATNILGVDALTLLPFGDSTPNSPQIGIGHFRNDTALDDWNDISRNGTGLAPFSPNLLDGYLSPPSSHWLSPLPSQAA